MPPGADSEAARDWDFDVVVEGLDSGGAVYFDPVRGGPVSAEDLTGSAYLLFNCSESVWVAAVSSDASSLSTKLCTIDETSSFSPDIGS